MEKEKIQSLISQMTLEEKAGMCSGADFWHLKGVERLGIPSVMVTDGPHGLRKQAYKEAIAEGVKWTLVGLAILAVLAGAGHLIGKAKKKLDKKKKGGSSA